MRKALPVITEGADIPKQRLQHEYDGRKKPRLQMLYLLASRQAQTRQDVAQLLGFTAIPSATGSPFTRWAGWLLCWRCTSRRASPSRCPQTR
jgi:hypothetical protein